MPSPIDDVDVELRCDNLSEGVLGFITLRGIIFSDGIPRYSSVYICYFVLLFHFLLVRQRAFIPAIITVSGLFLQGCISWHACTGAQSSQPCPKVFRRSAL